MIDNYNEHLFKMISMNINQDSIDNFVSYDDKKINWSEGLKKNLARKIVIAYEDSRIRKALYRPFSIQYLYFDKYLIERRYQMHIFFPISESEQDNHIICIPSIGSRYNFWSFYSNHIVDLNLTSLDNTHCFSILYIFR